MYSNDRKRSLSYTISCLKDMSLYDLCQKTLVVDGKIDSFTPDWDVVQVPRIDGAFSWANMWNAGVETAQYDAVLYLDADRLLPPNYLQSVIDVVRDDAFVFTSRHFMMLREIELAQCKKFLASDPFNQPDVFDSLLGAVRYEPRATMPFHGPGKNVMSGSVAFTKRTYRLLGGVDPWYRGHGAFADTDFHFLAALSKCSFIDIKVPELHFPHKKSEQSKVLSAEELNQKSIDNFIYYCKKWGLPLLLVENMVLQCGIANPSRYVDQRITELFL
jgi:hypothetical protein